MAKKKIELNLQFSANTDKARKSLEALEKQLNNFSTGVATDFSITKSINQAQDQAAKLTAALRAAVNVDTGKFDLSKFQHSLKNSNTDLKTLRDTLVKAGPEGTKTFMALAQSIVAAEVPTKRVNANLEKMLKTLKDTARWQLSSTIVHGLQGALQEAYGYAQDLNRSLNDIRIVTGYNTEHMEEFASQANKAAKALSTTTNEYAKASLIYFQQGLSDKEVEKRTQATIKMANVTGEAAEDVSSYMTAVWNNFDNGTKKLEYYADAITALGAATASSSEEIATGLQKFSAVASTVGLSYEYATAALATVTSQTRESAETVGTAFKTIFARLESLSLGETLEDDTTMTKYSQSLATVGVNIKTANGDLKDMDTIIDELGSKWNGISKDQQIALAQTVAGMRQYNNFIALLDNYETMKLNVEIAADSEGTLDEQAAIYAESWEAASDRVRAAAETIYAKILDDDFFINLLNGFEKILTLLDRFIDSAGGLHGILFGLSSVLLNTFSGKAAEGLENMAYNAKEFFGLNKKETVDYKERAIKLIEDMPSPSGDTTSVSEEEKIVLQNKLAAQLKLADIQDKLSASQRRELEYLQETVEKSEDYTLELIKQKQIAEDNKNDLGTKLANEDEKFKNIINKLSNNSKGAFGFVPEEMEPDFQPDQDIYILSKGTSFLWDMEKEAEDAATVLELYSEELGVAKKDLEEFYNTYKEKGNITEQLAQAEAELDEATQKYNEQTERATATLNKFNDAADEALGKKKTLSLSENIVGIAQGITSLASTVSMLSGIVDTIKDPDATGWEKFVSVLTSMTMIIPLVSSSIKALTEVQWKNMGAQIKETAAQIADILVDYAQVKSTKEVTEAKKENVEVNKEVANKENVETISKIDWKGAAKGLGKVAGKVGLVAAGIAVIVVAITGVVHAIQKADRAAQKAEKNAALLKEEAEAAKSAYKELSETIKSFDDGAKALEELTKGTLEYKEALLAANSQAIELIRNNSNLSGQYETVNGQIVFNEGVLENLKEEEFNKLASKEAAAYAAEIQAIEARNEAQRIDLARDVNSSAGFWGGVGNVINATSAAGGAGALIGTAINPGAGTLIGMGVGGAVGLTAGTIAQIVEGVSSGSEQEALEKILENAQAVNFATDEDFREFLTSTEIGIKDQLLVDSLVKNRETIEKLTKEVNLEAEQTMLLRKQMAISNNQDLDGFENDIYNDLITSALAYGYGDTVAGKKASAAEEISDLWKDDNKDFWDKYIKEIYGVENGAQVQGGMRVKHLGGNKVTLERWDDENQKWEVVGDKRSLREKDAEQTLINQMSTNLTEEEYNKLSKEMSDLVKKVQDLGISDFETAKSMVLSYIESGETDDKRSWNLNELSINDLYSQNFQGTQFKDAAEKAKASWESFRDSLNSVIKGSVLDENNSIQEFLKNANKTTIEGYVNALETVLQGGGKVAYDKFQPILQDILERYPNQANEVLKIIGSISWDNGIQSAEEFINQLYNINIATEETELKDIFNNIDVSVFKRNVNEIINTLSNITKLTKDIGFGSIISEKDYDTLVKYNSELRRSFILTAEGYRYTGEINLQEQVKEYNKNLLAQTLQQNAKARSGSNFAQDLRYRNQKINWSTLGAGKATKNYENAIAETLLSYEGGLDILQSLGWNSESFKALIEEDTEESREKLQGVFKEVSDLITADATGAYNDSLGYQVYASTLTTYDELNQAFADGLLGYGEEAKRIYKSQLEEIKRIKIEIRSLARDSLSKYYDFQISRLEDKAFSAADTINLLSEKINNETKNLERYEANIKNIGAKFGITQGNEDFNSYLERIIGTNKDNWTDAEVEELNTFLDGYTSAAESIVNMNKQIADTTVKYFDDIINKYEDFSQQADHINGLVKLYANIIDITGTGLFENAQETLADLGKATEIVQTKNLEASKRALDELQITKEVLKGEYDLLKQDNEIIDEEYWDKSFKEIDDKIAKQQEELQSSWEETLKTVADNYIKNIGNTIKQFSKDMANGATSSLNELSEAFERQSVLNDQYVDDYKSIYEFSKLTRNIEKSINDTNSIKAKNALRDLQLEITELQNSGKEISEYDLELLQKKYDLRVAEIALEEAQNAKSTVRLSRDAAGNWGYVYTQNAEEVSAAAQTYEDKIYALQELGSSYLEETGQKVIQIQTEFSAALEEIWSNQELSAEEKQAKAEEITKYYTERLKYYTSEYDKTIANNIQLYREDFSAYSEITGYKIQASEDFATSFEDSVLGALGMGYENGASIYEKFVDTVGSVSDGTGLLETLNTGYQEYVNTVDNIFEIAGYNLDTYEKDIKNKISGEDGKGGMIGEMNKLFNTFSQELSTDSFKALRSISEELETWWTSDMSLKLKEYLATIELVKSAFASISTISVDNIVNTNDSDLIDSFNRGIWDVSKKNAKEFAIGKGLSYKQGDVVKNITKDSGINDIYGAIKQYVVNDDGSYNIERLNEVLALRSKQDSEDSTTQVDIKPVEVETLDHVISPIGTNYFYTEDKQWYKNNSGSPIVKGTVLSNDELSRHTKIKDPYVDWVNDLDDQKVKIKNAERYNKDYGVQTYSPDDLSSGDFKYTSTLNDKTIIGAVRTPNTHNMGYIVINLGGPQNYAIPLKNIELPKVKSFDTGGYTGQWGSTGRLAMLHQKEIVLNADDTVNFLSAIQLIRDISERIDLQAAAATSSFGSLAVRSMHETAQTLQQEVTIHAEFPNVTSHTEIEQALDNLINRSSQYANRNF